jgi:hypothetical protein
MSEAAQRTATEGQKPQTFTAKAFAAQSSTSTARVSFTPHCCNADTDGYVNPCEDNERWSGLVLASFCAVFGSKRSAP